MNSSIRNFIDIGRGNALLEFLYKNISEERKQRFETVSKQRSRYITVAIENIFQSHNASAVLRSCDCFGVQDVHIIEGINKFNPNVDIALGAEKWLDIHKYSSENAQAECYAALRNKGYAIAATTPHNNPISINELPLDKPLALVFGNEKDGLSREAIEQADYKVALPMNGFTESFNISVSVALFLQKSIRNSENLLKIFENAEND